MYADYLTENMTEMVILDAVDTIPEGITHIIQSRSNFDVAFVDFSLEVDFEKEMFILYFFTDIYNGFDCVIKQVKFKNRKLTLILLHKMAKGNIFGVQLPKTPNF